MKKKKLFKSIMCAFLAIILCLPLNGCAAIVAKKVLDEKRSATPIPTQQADNNIKSDTGGSSEKDDKWDIAGTLNGIAEDIGGTVGAGLNQFSEELGSTFGKDVQKIGQDNKVDTTGTPSPTGSTSYKDVLNDLDTDDIGKVVDTVEDIVGSGDQTGDEKKDNDEGDKEDAEPLLEGPYHISYVIDGDTVKFEEWGFDVKCRLVGIDTPESTIHPDYAEKTGKQNTQEGKDASSFMKEYLPKGTVVWVERDVETQDRYGRELIYLFCEKDGEIVFVNELLLREGYAQQFTLAPNVKYADNKFLEAQRYARENKKGFWASGFFDEKEAEEENR